MNSTLSRIDLLQKLSLSRKNICFETIRIDSKSTGVRQAWTKVYRQIFVSWKVQTW